MSTAVAGEEAVRGGDGPHPAGTRLQQHGSQTPRAADGRAGAQNCWRESLHCSPVVSLGLSVCLLAGLSVGLSACGSVCRSVWQSACRSLSLSVFLLVCLFVCLIGIAGLTVCLSFRLFFCLPVCLSV